MEKIVQAVKSAKRLLSYNRENVRVIRWKNCNSSDERIAYQCRTNEID